MHHSHPKKHLGQHFLQDPNVIRKIVQAINPQPNDRILEIGPGQGALTRHLLKHVNQLHVVEIDADAIAVLTEQCPADHLIIHHHDILDFSVHKIADHDLRVVGNLPYNISTPLLFHVLKSAEIIADMVFMLQREVAMRMVAKPHNKTYGRLSVMVQYACDVEVLFHVGANAFFPPPKVESTVIRLTPKIPALKANDVEQLALVVRQAFGQRRKTIHNSLRGLIDDVQMQAVGINPKARAEELSVDDFVRLANVL